jgi:hypothetical protein
MTAKRAVQLSGYLLLAVMLLATSTWGTLALYFFDHESAPIRVGLAAGFAVMSLAVFIAMTAPQWRWRGLGAYFVLFVVLLASWCTIQPSNDREWQTEVAVLPHATINGDRVFVHRIRNFDYRAEQDFTVDYYDKMFDVRELDSVDLVVSYWMGPAIAHVFLTFGFSDGEHLAVSIEARKERTEAYSSLRGFFRQYELYYVVANERDVVRVRTNYRRDPPEDVYLYRLGVSRQNARRLFLEYMRAINALSDRPQFYNTLTTNCIGSIWLHTRVNPDHLPFSWKIFLSGYVPDFLYQAGKLKTALPFPELRQRSHINAPAQAADGSPDFSARIRAAREEP